MRALASLAAWSTLALPDRILVIMSLSGFWPASTAAQLGPFVGLGIGKVPILPLRALLAAIVLLTSHGRAIIMPTLPLAKTSDCCGVASSASAGALEMAL